MEPIKNIPGSISFSEGFLGPKGDVGFIMEYDHEKATKIINNLLQDGRKIESGTAGLDGDWNINHCTIYDAAGFHEYDAHSSSQWAAPILIVTFEDEPSETFEVWKREERGS